jgi:hypothetical protein
MTAYSMESHNHADVVTGIAAKIAEGANVSPLDLQALSEAAFSHMVDIPLLDRTYLQQEHVECPGTCKLVRYVGMVQDMLDTEFYLSERQGKPTHYRDLYHDNDEQDSDDFLSSDLADRLAERTPLVIVPIPFGSEWFLEKLQQERRPTNQNQDEYTSTMTPCVGATTDSRSTKKRDRDMENPSAEPLSKPRLDDDDGDDDEPCVVPNDDSMECEGTSGTEPNQQESSDTTTTTSSDWWPAGCMGSHTDHCPVLAKLYYDRNPKNTQRRLRLNDLVELIGVVSVDPLEADFSSQQQQQQQQQQVADDLYFEEAFADRLVLPPPSQLPRLHVLTFNLMDLDQVTKRVMVGSGDLGQEQDEQPSISLQDYDDSMEDCRMQATRMLSEALLHDNVVSEATLMALLSMAQRTLLPSQTDDDMPPCWECVSTPTEEATLGCASLNIQVPCASSCLALYQQLQSVLEDICPIVASIDLTREALNNNNTDLRLTAPRKDSQGHMLASPLQLPKGSTVLIHMGNMTEGALSPSGQETLCALQTLVTSHKVPYTFDGVLIKYPFEADYRVIVVSSKVSSKGRATKPQKKSKLLPCALQVSMDVPASSSNLDRALSPIHRDRLRRYLANCRCASTDDAPKRTRTLPGGANNVALSKQVLERAQADFIQRRVATRGSDNDLVTEEDFHRWLILTRLQGRSRNGERGATIQDWERSLKLDDAMKLSHS